MLSLTATNVNLIMSDILMEIFPPTVSGAPDKGTTGTTEDDALANDKKEYYDLYAILTCWPRCL